MKQKIKDVFVEYKIELENDELEKFEEFLNLFIEKNSKINLSAIREPQDIILKHFLDSIILNIFVEFEEGSEVLDMWTGGGFPLIPLSIINKWVEFVWVDSVWKKLKAIDDFAAALWLQNIKTINSRAEDLGQDLWHRESYDYVVSRATAYFPVLLEYVIPLLKVGWIFCAYKLDDKEELKSIKKALSRLSAKILKVKNYEIEWQKRVIVFIEKLQPTHKKYPRKIWIPVLKPIV
jgi:16S rRNA (guanine527-N7)-methyltransferase